MGPESSQKFKSPPKRKKDTKNIYQQFDSVTQGEVSQVDPETRQQ